jgi:uncharacterized membrane protein YqhA
VLQDTPIAGTIFACAPGLRLVEYPYGYFENLLWGSRLLVLVAIVAVLVLAVGAAYVATVGVFYFVGLLLVLAIEFFQRALRLNYNNSLDLLYLVGGILLISGAFYLIGLRSEHKKDPDEPDQDR